MIEGKIDSVPVRENRAKHYYSTWKIFFVNDLQNLNTDVYNRVTGTRGGIFFSSELRNTDLTEFYRFFRTASAFAYQRSLLTTYYFKKTDQQQQAWNNIVKKKKYLAKKLSPGYPYDSWIRFIRMLKDMI